MDGPWYQTSGPSVDDAIDEHVTLYKDRVTCDKEKLQSIVMACVKQESDKYGGLGSYQGYQVFVVKPLRESIEKSLGEFLMPHAPGRIKSQGSLGERD
jgi:hypothetical protein